MAIFSSSQPSIRARVLARFPAQVLAGTGITITKSGGTYVFAAQPYANIPITALQTIPSDRLLGRDTNGVGAVEILTAGGGLGFNGIGGLEISGNQRLRYISIPLFNAGAVLTTGIKADFMSPFAGTISQVTLLADQIGSVVVDIWKNGYANYPPTVANTITGSARPTLSSTVKSQDSILTGWDRSILAGDILRFNVVSVATITRLTIAIDVVAI